MHEQIQLGLGLPRAPAAAVHGKGWPSRCKGDGPDKSGPDQRAVAAYPDPIIAEIVTGQPAM